MSELFWPGDKRAGNLLSDEALLAAMCSVEIAWLYALSSCGVAADVELEFALQVGVDDIADRTESGGNPVIPLVATLRERVPESAARWLHRGLTSQDTLDTALMLCLRDALAALLADLHRQVETLSALADAHRHSVQAGRTLTQHAVPTTFGLTAATWLTGVLDAAEDIAAVCAALPVQAGGAAGTLAAPVALTGSPAAAQQLVAAFAGNLDLVPAPPWHTSRRSVTRVADALVAGVDAFGRIANDVLVLTRPEIAELAEPAPGGSSTMPHKQNPVLSVLVKRAALAAPFPAAQLHAAAAAAVDQRPDGAWHAEWSALRTLARLAVVAASQTAELLAGLVVAADRMRATAEASAGELLAERRAVAGDSDDGRLESYLGAADALIDQAIERAEQFGQAAP